MIVTVVYAIPHRFWSAEFDVKPKSRVGDVIALAKQHNEFANLSEESFQHIAVWGEEVDLGYVLEADDRIELLRPLKHHPMDRRRKLADQNVENRT